MTFRESSNDNSSLTFSEQPPTSRQNPAYGGGEWAANTNGKGSTSGKASGRRAFLHLKDLQAQAQAKGREYSTLVPIRTLLGNAQTSIDRVNTDVTYKRPDLAFIEYLVGSEILLNVVPKHKDFPAMRADRSKWYQLYQSLTRQVEAQHEVFEEIRSTIEEDNAKHGTQPMSGVSRQWPGSASNGSLSVSTSHRPLSMPESPHKRLRSEDELFLPPNGAMGFHSPNQRSALQRNQQSPRLRKERPVVLPKPDSLHSHASSQNNNASSTLPDALSERFSAIRILQKRVQDNGAAGTENIGKHIFEIPSPTKHTPPSESSWSSVTKDYSTSEELFGLNRPSGPREMPTLNNIPVPPPKIPLAIDKTIMLPRAPSPAYDPSKAMKGSVSAMMPNSSRKSFKNGSDAHSPVSNKRLSGLQLAGVESRPPSRQSAATPRPLSGPTAVSATELHENLRTHDVLLIDVRTRTEYDEGHINARSIMCVEPLTLKPGTSAEDLEDRLVISPESEQSLFERRKEFDLVIYYDQNTSSDRFLQGPPTRSEAGSLRALHDALFEFNDYKPLRQPPLLLTGGLDAWVDLMGSQALATSSTSAVVGSMADKRPLRKASRPLGRVAMASANSSLEVRKRRLREQNTLNADEERKWLDKARDERVNLSNRQNSHSDSEDDGNGEEPPSPFIHTYENFFRRFPEPSAIQQSMMVAPPPPPARPPLSPSRRPPQQLPPPPVIPSIPSRPPPALPRPSYSGVSERDASQASPIARQSSSSQYPLFTPRSTSRFLKLPHTGLVNFGVTCYMNATVQCLLATIPLSQFFLDNRWPDYVQKNWKGSNGIMPNHFANLIRSLWCDDCTAIRPTSLRAFCSRLKPEWGDDKQQDAKEFLEFIVDCLHEDLNVNFARTPLKPLSPSQELRRERMPIREAARLEWQRYCHREQSMISDIFAGQHASRLRCTTCQNTSTTYEAFYSISVEIPRHNRKQGWSIHDCLRSYTMDERLSSDEMWKCPYCKCEREATKQITITRAPNFLVVHFKRFEMRKGESARKIHTPIDFPLFGLDMGPYMVSPPSAEEVQQQQRDPSHVPDMAATPPYLYDAYAVMRHIGTSGNGGHYISLVRDASRGCWRKFDDDRATDIPDPTKLKPDYRLQNEQAYIVLYCRVPAR